MAFFRDKEQDRVTKYGDKAEKPAKHVHVKDVAEDDKKGKGKPPA